MTPTVRDILIVCLHNCGYGGLYNDDGCGCGLADLAPCGGDPMACRAGYRRETPGGEADYVIGPEPEPESEIEKHLAAAAWARAIFEEEPHD